MNIIESLNQDSGTYSFEYFGINDYSTSWDIELILDNSEIIKEYYNSIEFEIKDINSFIDYLFLKKFSEFSALSKHISDDKKDAFNNIASFIYDKHMKCEIKSILRFINSNIIELLRDCECNVIESIIDIIISYHSGAINSIVHICKVEYPLFLNYFDRVSHFIRKYDLLLDEFLDVKHIDDIKQGSIGIYLQAIVLLNKFDKCKGLIDNIIEELNVYGKSVFDIITIENVLQHERPIKALMQFYREIQHRYYSEYKTMMDKVVVIINDHLHTHGHTYSYEIPYSKMIAVLENPEVHLFIKILSLTHLQQKDKSWKSYHAVLGESNEKAQYEMIVTSNIPTNEYFSQTKQQNLNLYDQAFLTMLANYYITKERLSDFFAMLYEATQEVVRRFNIDYEDEMQEEFNMIFSLFLSFLHNNDKKDFSNGISYALTMFLCGMIEKLLRMIYLKENSSIYIKTKSFSLGNLLNLKNKTMVKIFGEDNIRVFAYYLVQGGDIDEVGFNYRNNYAHYKNVKIENIEYGVTLKVLQIYIMMVNELTLYKLKQDKERESNNG